MPNERSEGGKSKECMLCLASGFSFLCGLAAAWLAHRKSEISCAEKYHSFSYAEAIEKICLWVEFFSLKVVRFGKEGGRRGSCNGSDLLAKCSRSVKLMWICIMRHMSPSSCIHSARKWGECVKAKCTSKSILVVFRAMFVSQLYCMPSISKGNICPKLIPNCLTSIRQTQSVNLNVWWHIAFLSILEKLG